MTWFAASGSPATACCATSRRTCSRPSASRASTTAAPPNDHGLSPPTSGNLAGWSTVRRRERAERVMGREATVREARMRLARALIGPGASSRDLDEAEKQLKRTLDAAPPAPD